MGILEQRGSQGRAGNAFDLEGAPLGHEGEAEALQKGEEGKEAKDRSCSRWSTGTQKKEAGSPGMSCRECGPTPWPVPWPRP